MDFDALYREQAPAVAGFFLRRVRDPEIAADLTAETFAAALAAAPEAFDEILFVCFSPAAREIYARAIGEARP